MKNLKDVFDKTNELYPYENLKTRQYRFEILRELFSIDSNYDNWINISIDCFSEDLFKLLK